MSLQDLIDSNRINYETQEWSFKEIMNMLKIRLKEKKVMIYKDKYTWPTREECNITAMIS